MGHWKNNCWDLLGSSASPSQKGDFFTKMAEENPDLKDAYLAKRDFRGKMFERTHNKELFDENMKLCMEAFDATESQLNQNASGKYYVCVFFFSKFCCFATWVL